MKNLLSIIVALLIVGWLFGYVALQVNSDFIHLLLILALGALVLRLIK